ncbi:TraC family protein [Patescibacteria group bacterium]|nr:TraC family protein [Patescibacteria group bacterium]MCG2695270.1 TraC family protein [Candidatus Parcubacteria bacterium]
MPKQSATQDFVPVKEIRDGIIILKDGSLRAIMMVSSLNFSLKSSDEQEATLGQFQNFLNSLDFFVQIFVQSRRLDIRPYIAMMEERKKEQTNELIKIQTREYIEFIKNFTENVNIMSKNFFVVVPYHPAVITKETSKSFFSKKQEKTSFTDESFEENRSQLEQRISVVEQGLARASLRLVRLGTEEAMELLYKIFNPGELEKPIQIN